MIPLFEKKIEKYLNVPYKSIKDYNGELFPKLILEIINENKGNILFGGSSLIHDLYFNKETWEKRDYDLWCLEPTFNKIKRKLNRLQNCKKIKEDEYENQNKYYNRFKTSAIAEYNYIDYSQEIKNRIIKIQLINIGIERINIMNTINNIDLSFNTVFYDGEKLIYFQTTEEEILNKKGYFIPKKLISPLNHCSCIICLQKNKNPLNDKELQRIKKYKMRGFSITNLCPLCDNANAISLKHCSDCWKNKLKITTENNFYKDGNQITKNHIEIIKKEMTKYKENSFLLASIMMIISTRNIDLILETFNNFKEYFDISSCAFNLILTFQIEIGFFTGFKLFFELIEPHLTTYSNKRIGELFTKSCQWNHHNIAKFLSEKYPRCNLTIFEDKIIDFKYLNTFEYFFLTNDLTIITKEYNSIFITTEESEENCSICQTDFPNLILCCKHRFCSNCLINYYQLQLNKNLKLNCPMCRTDI